MQRITFVLASFALVGAASASIAVGCGSDDPAPIPPPPDAAASSTSSSTSSSSGDVGTSSSSSGGGTSSSSGGPDASASSSSGGPNPGKISCGAAECDAGGDNGGVCCAREAGTAPQCLTNDNAGACDNSLNANTIQLGCDEAADCPRTGGGTQLQCCFVRGGGEIRSQCAFQCVTEGGPGPAARRPQLCKTSAECGDGGAGYTCEERTCRGFKLKLCAGAGTAVDACDL